MLAKDLPDPWAPPVRVKLMNEQLIAFKDTTGRIALLQEFCAHRRASLFLARNEGEQSPDGQPGLRCAYHGWKFDVTGQCIDMPNEPPTSRFKDHVKLKSYPAVERGGIVWSYMGPPELMPDLPELEWAVVPADQRYISRRMETVAFTQAVEGGIDSSHASFLHSDGQLWSGFGPIGAAREAGAMQNLMTADTAPRFFIEPTEYGLLIGARRNTPDGKYYWRITQYLMPWYTFIPGGGGDGPRSGHAWVPIDDETCWTWSMTYHPDRPLNAAELASCTNGHGIHTKLIPGTELPAQNAENDYLIDRVMQKHLLSISGIDGTGAQDQAVQESMGPKFDPSQEQLGSSDSAIIAMRRRMIAESRALAAGTSQGPSNLDPRLHRVRSAATVLTQDESWIDATAEQRKAVTRYYAEA
jgi:phenylpropionate dioxygenase-like ring-hydroxylating dioxygenase large terminal subunit